nr:MAG TPA: hypothetical protein [Bacteriophage sp.]
MKTIKLEDLFFKTIICGFYLALFAKVFMFIVGID